MDSQLPDDLRELPSSVSKPPTLYLGGASPPPPPHEQSARRYGSGVDVLKHGSDVTALSFNPDGGILAVATLDGQIALWDAKTAEQTGSIDGRADVAGGRSALSKASKRNALGTKHFSSLAFSADGTAVLAGDGAPVEYNAEQNTRA